MKRSLITILINGLVIFITGCASVPMPTQEGSLPPQMKSVEYYKKNLTSVVQKAQRTNDPATQMELAYVYGNTWYDVPDLKLSNYWLEKAAAQDNLPALCALSARHYQGNWELSKDFDKADKLVNRAYEVYISKPKKEWHPYDIFMMAGALLNRGEHAKIKEQKNRDICLSKSLDSKVDYIRVALTEYRTKCD